MNPHHKQFERDIITFLESRNFRVTSATYHEVMPEDAKKMLQNLYTPTALYLRGRSDRIAQHPPLAFEWEAKTNGGQWPNLATEMLPLAHHIHKAKLGVRCLYLYRDKKRGYEKGFWVDELPPVGRVYIPDRWTDFQVSWFKWVAKEFFPTAIIIEGRHTGGTDDPFVLILEKDVKRLQSWQDLILDEVQKTEKYGLKLFWNNKLTVASLSGR